MAKSKKKEKKLKEDKEKETKQEEIIAKEDKTEEANDDNDEKPAVDSQTVDEGNNWITIFKNNYSQFIYNYLITLNSGLEKKNREHPGQYLIL